MKGFIVLALGTLALVGCLIQPVFGANTTSSTDSFCPVLITAEPGNYVNTMSSTVGIGLTPAVALSSIDPSRIQYKWTTNFGYFVDWKAPNNKVKKLGTTLINSGDKIYWTYLTLPKIKKNTTSEITVNLTATDKKTKKVIGKAFLPITWNETIFNAGNSTCVV